MTEPTAPHRVSPMKPLFPILGILVAVFVALLVIRNKLARVPMPTAGAPQALEMGATLPDFTLNRFGGGSTTLSKLASKITFINFWATWCDACMEEMPSIVSLRNAYKDKGFEVVAVNVDDNPASVLPRITGKLKINFPVYVDPQGTLTDWFDVHAIPLSVIIDRNRKILLIENGGRNWDDNDMRSQLNEWLSAK